MLHGSVGCGSLKGNTVAICIHNREHGTTPWHALHSHKLPRPSDGSYSRPGKPPVTSRTPVGWRTSAGVPSIIGSPASSPRATLAWSGLAAERRTSRTRPRRRWSPRYSPCARRSPPGANSDWPMNWPRRRGGCRWSARTPSSASCIMHRHSAHGNRATRHCQGQADVAQRSEQAMLGAHPSNAVRHGHGAARSLCKVHLPPTQGNSTSGHCYVTDTDSTIEDRRTYLPRSAAPTVGAGASTLMLSLPRMVAPSSCRSRGTKKMRP